MYIQTTKTVIGDEESVIESVSVTVPCAGEIDEQFFIADASGWDEIAANVVGIVGVPVEIATDMEFEEATLTFQYDPALLNGASEDNLGILWYDKENLAFVEMENVSVDKTKHTVSCVTTHFSEYLVVDMEAWRNAWLTQTAEQDQKVIESCEKLKELGVNIYAVSETDATVPVIEQAATSTGGKHYNAYSGADAPVIWKDIHEREKTIAYLDVDSDGDGLLDGYEIYGMRIQNGQVITTDPENPDTDGDDEKKDGSRNDGAEMGKMTNVTVKVEAAGTKREFTVFKMISNPKESDNLSDAFIYVDSLDYMPVCGTLTNAIYNNQVTDVIAGTPENPVNRDGEFIYGLANLHNSLDMPQNVNDILVSYTTWLTSIYIADIGINIPILPLELMKHYFYNVGTTYNYDGRDVYSSSVKLTSLYNFYDIKDECVNVLKPDEVRYIATSYSNEWQGAYIGASDLSSGLLDVICNPIAFASVNSAHAAMVAECSYDGNLYTLKFKYYILDYYDWDYSKHPNLYNFNIYGLCNTYQSVGKITGYATFTKDSEITICVTSI